MVLTPMQEVLAPCFMAADYLAPPWRRCVEACRSIEVAAECARYYIKRNDCDRELLELRETLELFALALAVDPAGFFAAVRDEDAPIDPNKYPGETLRLKVVERTARWRDPVKIFFDGWTEAHGSFRFQATKTAIEALVNDAERRLTARPRIRVELELRVEWDQSCTDVTFMADLLPSIDPGRFEVDYIALVVYYAALEPSSLMLLFRHLESWRSRGAHVVIEVHLPGDHHVSSFTQWKTLFGLVARRGDAPAFPPLNETACGGTWKVTIKCSENDPEREAMIDIILNRSGAYYTAARLFIASVVPLVRADVSEVTLGFPLDDASGEEEAVDEKPVRLKWLAFLLRIGRCCPSWRLPFISLLDDDVVEMLDVFAVDTAHEVMEKVWMTEWGGDDFVNEAFSAAETAQLYQDIESAVHDALSLGQHEGKAGGMALSVSLANDNEGLRSLGRLAALLDPQLTELSIEGVSVPVSTVSKILTACPSLSKLTISVLIASVADDNPWEAIQVGHHHPLRSFGAGITSMDALACLPVLLHKHTIALDELSISCSPGTVRQVPTKDPQLIMDSILLATSESLSILSVTGLSVRACALPRVWAFDHVAARLRLKTLVLDRVVWQDFEFESLMTHLANESHPLTRSLETIRICDATGDIPHVTASLVAMLESNSWLKHVDLTLSLVGVPLIERQFLALATHDMVTRRRQGPLSLCQKLACLVACANVIDHESLSQVFAFAAPTEVRIVTFATPVKRETRAVRFMN